MKSKGNERDIFAAASLGDRDRVQQLLDADSTLALAQEESGKTPLHRAAWGGYKEIIERLLEAGADVNARDAIGRTPLIHLVAWCTRNDVVDLLLERGADLNATDADGNTALYLAASCIRRPGHCWGDHARLTQHLLNRGAALDIFTAAILNRTDEAATLLDANSQLVHVRDQIVVGDTLGWNVVDGATPLHRAADCGHAEMTALLLARGADVGVKDARGRTALVLAAHDAGTRKMKPSPEVAEILLQGGVAEDIFAAAIRGRNERVTQLLAADSSQSNARDAGGATPLHFAAWNGQKEMAELLVAHGADVNARNSRGETPLAITGNPEVIELLLGLGAECDVFTAVRLGRQDLIANCLSADPALVNTKNRRGRTLLRLAAEPLFFGDASKRGIVEFLLTNGAEMDLWTAATLNQTEAAAALLDADPSLRDAFDNTVTPLHCAVQSGHLPTVELLVERGAALDPVAHDLMTPTIAALWSDKKEIARYLTAQGANLEAMDNWADKPWIAAALA